MSGVAISPALRERARQGMLWVYKKIGKDATFIQLCELDRAYVLSGNDAEKYVKVINNRLRELYQPCFYFVLSDADEERLREINDREYKNCIWCIWVLNGIIDTPQLKVKEKVKYLSTCYGILCRTNHTISADKIDLLSPAILEYVEHVKRLAEEYPRCYLRGLHQLYSNDLVRFVLKKEGEMQKLRMQLPLYPNEQDLKIGPNNLDMPYCSIPEFLKQFPKHHVPREFSDLCHALALVCHNSEYARKQANQFAEEHERNTKRLKTKE